MLEFYCEGKLVAERDISYHETLAKWDQVATWIHARPGRTVSYRFARRNSPSASRMGERRLALAAEALWARIPQD